MSSTFLDFAGSTGAASVSPLSAAAAAALWRFFFGAAVAVLAVATSKPITVNHTAQLRIAFSLSSRARVYFMRIMKGRAHNVALPSMSRDDVSVACAA